jgi:hypothetical protein
MNMCEKSHGWWDRDLDNEGQRIRSDVRTAAHQIWQRARSQAESVLGDSAMAGELMELAVAQASRYLDRKQIPLDSQSHVGLLLVTFWRLLERHRAKLSRLEPMGDINDFSERLPDRTWSSQIVDHLDSEKIVRLLSDQARIVLALRNAGYEWGEIGQLLNGSVVTIKGSFWREIGQIRERLKLAGVSRKAR